MSVQPSHDLLTTLRRMRAILDSDLTARTPSRDQLYTLLVKRIADLETAQSLTLRGVHRAR